MNTNTGKSVRDFGYGDVVCELGMFELENGDIALIGNNITIIDIKTLKKFTVVEDIQATSIIQLSDGSFVINTSLADMFHYNKNFTHIIAQGRCNCERGLIEYSPGTILRVAPATTHVDGKKSRN
jgi:homogentisate 1,2-dioxygenase